MIMVHHQDYVKLFFLNLQNIKFVPSGHDFVYKRSCSKRKGPKLELESVEF